MGVVVPIVSAVAGVASTAYGIISSENQRADVSNVAADLSKQERQETIKADIAALRVQRQETDFYYKKFLDESVRKVKFRDSVTIGVGVVLLLIGITITIKMTSEGSGTLA
jgi:hypothetical protein